MMNLIRRILNDITHGQNIDLYVTLLAAILVSFINFFGVGSFEIAPEPVILILLIILVIDALVKRHQLNQINFTINKPKKEIFFIELTDAQQKELDRRVRDCNDLMLIGNSLSRTLDQYYDVLEAKMKKGHKVRVVMGDPNGLAMDMTVKRKYMKIDVSDWRRQVRATLEVLENLKLSLPSEYQRNLEIRTIDYNLTHGSIHIDLDASDGLLFLWYRSFKTRKHSRPKYLLEEDDGYWYQYFAEEANAIWNNSSEWNNVT